MTQATPPAGTPAGAEPPVPLVNPAYAVAAVIGIGVMIVSVLSPSLWFLNFVHVFCAVLWTGIDLYVGLVLGPVMRRVDFRARAQIINRLMPRMLFLMPVVSINTGTAGWFLAERMGYLDLPWPAYGWVAGSLVLVTIMTIQGLGFLMPVNVKIALEIRKPAPDGERIGRLMRMYVRSVAAQGLMQVMIVIIMARFGAGLAS